MELTGHTWLEVGDMVQVHVLHSVGKEYLTYAPHNETISLVL